MIPEHLLDIEGNLMVSLFLGRIGLALLYIIIASVVLYILPPLVQRSVLKWAEMRSGGELSERRTQTIGRLMLYLTRATIFVVTTFLILHLFINTSGLFTFLGLFTAAVAFSIRQLVSDYITGFVFLFEDLFAIGEDVEIGDQRGVVEDVSLRTTLLRAPSGETFIVPNGDIRVVHNYTRGDFSLATVQVPVKSDQLGIAITALETLTRSLPQRIPVLLSNPEIQIGEGALGANIELTVRARTRHGREDEARRRMFELVRQTLDDHGVRIGEQSE